MAGKTKHLSDDTHSSSEDSGKRSGTKSKSRTSRRKSNATPARKTKNRAKNTSDEESDAQISSEDTEPEVIKKGKKRSSTARKTKVKAKNTSDEEADAQITSEESEPDVFEHLKKKTPTKGTSRRAKKYADSEDSDFEVVEKTKKKSSTARKSKVKSKGTSDEESEPEVVEKKKKKPLVKRASEKHDSEDSDSEGLKKTSQSKRTSGRLQQTYENSRKRPKRSAQGKSEDLTEKGPVDQPEDNGNEASSQEDSEHSDADEQPLKKPKEKRERKPRTIRPKKEEEDQYEVEAILDFKIEDKIKYFLIRWKGYDSSVDSWEDRLSLKCPGLIAKFYEAHPEARAATRKRPKKADYQARKKNKKTPTGPRPLKIDEEPDYDSEAFDENQEWKVERIIDVRFHRDGKRDFLIRWEGYSSKSDSWEPESNLDCDDLIKRFMVKLDKITNVTVREMRPWRKPTQHFTLMTQSSDRRLSKRLDGRQRAVYYDCEE